LYEGGGCCKWFDKLLQGESITAVEWQQLETEKVPRVSGSAQIERKRFLLFLYFIVCRSHTFLPCILFCASVDAGTGTTSDNHDGTSSSRSIYGNGTRYVGYGIL
jgi:hypothetical protein